MNDILKQRLVGALILVALGVVFWPIIFVEPGDPAAQQRERIPPRPDVDTTSLETPDMAGLRTSPETGLQREEAWEATTREPSEADSQEEPAVAAETAVQEPPVSAPPAPEPAMAEPVERTRTEAPAKPVLDSAGVPVAWILQVISVSSADKADQLRQRLLAMGHKAYVKRVKQGGKSLYRVYVGPKFERASLEKIQGEIDAEFGVSSMIARYVP